MKPINTLPVIAFTMGDPGGNGPEIVLRTLDYFASHYPFIPLVFGSKMLLDHMFLKSYVSHRSFEYYEPGMPLVEKTIYFVDSYSADNIGFNQPAASNGHAAYTYICDAYESVAAGVADAIVTAPICKESFQLANLVFTGHTTLLKSLAQVDDVSMAFYSDVLKVVLATIHVPLSEVSAMITPKLLEQKINHAVQFLKAIGSDRLKIAVAGLNPHAGENGMLGHEETDIFKPFLDNHFFGHGVEVVGPLSADTLFYRAQQGEFDCVVAMYHDQGLIPIKLNHFHNAVNITLGLPFVRTSPDHGTAFDRAYEQLSSIESMVAATQLACRLVKQQ